jgi:SAM-dependent methyltransferase
MTPAQLAVANTHLEWHRARFGYARSNVQFLEGYLEQLEDLPLAAGSFDLIISNCVINLSPDKLRVFREAFRVLKPGGRLAIADVVAMAEIPEPLRKDWELYTGCVAGAATAIDLKSWLTQAGFAQIRIEPKDGSREIIDGWFPGRRIEDFLTSATIEAVKPERNG